MTAAEPLWREGWEVEPCGDAEVEQAPQPVAYRDVETVPVGELL